MFQKNKMDENGPFFAIPSKTKETKGKVKNSFLFI